MGAAGGAGPLGPGELPAMGWARQADALPAVLQVDAQFRLLEDTLPMPSLIATLQALPPGSRVTLFNEHAWDSEQLGG